MFSNDCIVFLSNEVSSAHLQSSTWPQKLGAGRWIVRGYGSAGQVLGSWVMQ